MSVVRLSVVRTQPSPRSHLAKTKTVVCVRVCACLRFTKITTTTTPGVTPSCRRALVARLWRDSLRQSIPRLSSALALALAKVGCDGLHVDVRRGRGGAAWETESMLLKPANPLTLLFVVVVVFVFILVPWSCLLVLFGYWSPSNRFRSRSTYRIASATVTKAEKKVLGHSAFTSYTIEVTRDDEWWTVHRRFGQFDEMVRKLKRSAPSAVPQDPMPKVRKYRPRLPVCVVIVADDLNWCQRLPPGWQQV